ncbi:hypothetical protein [Bartonella vinsonii]|uniref:Uncharacterized protein n=1 Tax=Bartonella vinsonii TaxID=33047 RepID=A0A3S5C6Q3_BARVI|nr:hypothetical protein [Bartonella vinsonii]VEJ45715.1 Uncharacterised protein [Bartonella vinsonii]
MYNKSLLFCTAAIAVILLGIHFNAYAEILNADSGEVKNESGKSYNSMMQLRQQTVEKSTAKV